MHFLSRTILVCLGLFLCSVTPRWSSAADDDPPKFRDIPVSTWIERLKDNDVEARRNASTALAKDLEKCGPSAVVAKALSAALFDLLKDADTAVRRQAALALMRFERSRPFETEAPTFLPLVLDALKDSDAVVRHAACLSLVRIRRDDRTVLGPLTRLLEDSDETVRQEAAAGLGVVDPRAAAVPALMGALDDKSPGVRATAAYSLGRLREAARPAVPRLVAALKDANEGVRSNAVVALGDIRLDAAACVPPLILALKSEATRESAARALGRFGPAAKTAAPELVPMFSDPDEYVRRTALMALVDIDPEGEKTQAALVAGLRDPAEMIRSTAALLCEKLGPKAKAAVPVLIAQLKDEQDEELRSYFGAALKRIDPEAAKTAGVP
jgi:HEAT repeat protein